MKKIFVKKKFDKNHHKKEIKYFLLERIIIIN